MKDWFNWIVRYVNGQPWMKRMGGFYNLQTGQFISVEALRKLLGEDK
ncbi:hypothetical protein IJJ12_01280 [bacterium]|nr:hypothetical protein [bacterium]